MLSTALLSTALQVALGGAIGSLLRWLAGVGLVRLFGMNFPMGIWPVNVLGSFLIGMFVVYAAHRDLTHLSPLVMVGLLGGFTTFSAFSLETVTLLERGAIGQALIYITLSVGLSLVALFAGLMSARGIWA